ncbi:P27 family phage terminase small subunit [Psychrobacillus faecigallinarum]|nr:P27 family phage terminase small subunit [Psychrobacillus faecigallinarum]
MVKVTDLEKQMLGRVDPFDMLEISKVKRYISIEKQIRKLQQSINKDGVMVTTVNASQEFIKANPALNELNKLTKTLIALENSIKFTGLPEPLKKENDLDSKDNDEPKVSDLY